MAINTMGSHKRMADEHDGEFGGRSRGGAGFANEGEAAHVSLREAVKLLGTAFEMRHARPKKVKDGTVQGSHP